MKSSQVSLFFALSLCFFCLSSTASAARDFSGYLWSETVGWISLTGPGHGLVADESTGILSGYAWSEHIGWITANVSELTGCPASPCEARIDSSEQLTGWLKVMSGGSAQSGGFSGWIRLRGTGTDTVTGLPFTYGASANTSGDFSGFAWGSTVVGWVDFSYAQIQPLIPGTPSATARCSTTTNSATFTLSNEPAATSYEVVLHNASSSITTVHTNPASVFSVAAMGWGNFTWSARACSATGCSGYAATTSLQCLPPPPEVDITAQTSLISMGTVANLRWTVTANHPTQCSLGGGGLNQVFTYAAGVNTNSPNPYPSNQVYNTTDFTLSCLSQIPGLTLSAVVDLERVEVVPLVEER